MDVFTCGDCGSELVHHLPYACLATHAIQRAPPFFSRPRSCGVDSD
jgi:hypothetical protein